MKRWAGPAWLLGGIALGAVVTPLIAGLIVLPFGIGRSTVLLDRLPTNLLGRSILGPASPHFVADSRPRWGSNSYLEFYPAPVPAGSTLCRVSVHTVFLGGEDLPARIDVISRYGLASNSPGACAELRDFGGLFEIAGVGEPGDAVGPLIQAVEEARSDNAHFGVECRHRAPGPCDGIRALRALDLSHTGSIEALRYETVGDRTVMTHRHALHWKGDRTRPPFIAVTVRSERTTRDGRYLVQDVRIESLGGVDLDLDG